MSGLPGAPGASSGTLASYLRSLPYVASWIFFSSATILFNKWVLASTQFTYPIALSCWHMLFATILTQVAARTTSLITVPEITRDFYLRKVVPIALAFGVSLITANSAYMYLSVAFIQMIKASTPMVVLLLSFAAKIEQPSVTLFFFVGIVSMGVMISTVGELYFNSTGFMLQLVAVVVESARLVMIQLLVSGSVKLDALGSLYLYAPAALATMLVVFIAVELPRFSLAALWDVGVPLLVLNALTAFCLNLAVVTLIKNTSPIVLTLSGVIKDILLVSLSILMHGAVVAPIQWAGFSLSTVGIFLFNMYKKHLTELRAVGDLLGAAPARVAAALLGCYAATHAHVRTTLRSASLFALLVLIVVVPLVLLFGPASAAASLALYVPPMPFFPSSSDAPVVRCVSDAQHDGRVLALQEIVPRERAGLLRALSHLDVTLRDASAPIVGEPVDGWDATDADKRPDDYNGAVLVLLLTPATAPAFHAHLKRVRKVAPQLPCLVVGVPLAPALPDAAHAFEQVATALRDMPSSTLVYYQLREELLGANDAGIAVAFAAAVLTDRGVPVLHMPPGVLPAAAPLGGADLKRQLVPRRAAAVSMTVLAGSGVDAGEDRIIAMAASPTCEATDVFDECLEQWWIEVYRRRRRAVDDGGWPTASLLACGRMKEHPVRVLQVPLEAVDVGAVDVAAHRSGPPTTPPGQVLQRLGGRAGPFVVFHCDGSTRAALFAAEAVGAAPIDPRADPARAGGARAILAVEDGILDVSRIDEVDAIMRALAGLAYVAVATQRVLVLPAAVRVAGNATAADGEKSVAPLLALLSGVDYMLERAEEIGLVLRASSYDLNLLLGDDGEEEEHEWLNARIIVQKGSSLDSVAYSVRASEVPIATLADFGELGSGLSFAAFAETQQKIDVVNLFNVCEAARFDAQYFDCASTMCDHGH